MSEEAAKSSLKRGRPRTKSDAQRRADARAQVKQFRSKGERLDLLVTPSCVRTLDKICARTKLSRRHVVEALVRIASESADESTLIAAIEAVAGRSDVGTD